jgi:hypothetical protein
VKNRVKASMVPSQGNVLTDFTPLLDLTKVLFMGLFLSFFLVCKNQRHNSVTQKNLAKKVSENALGIKVI